MNAFEKSKWIWISETEQPDEYGEFFQNFDLTDTQNTLLRISCDGDYTIFINGKYAASNQYGDFEHYKVYDEIDITDFVNAGTNYISLLVWHIGKNTSRYKNYKAGVIFEIFKKDRVILSSNECTRARKSQAYESGRCGIITGQLGFGFHYDATREDGSFFTGECFGNAVAVEKHCDFYPRENKKLLLKNLIYGVKDEAEINSRYFLIDLFEERVGLISFKFTSDTEQKIRIDWGEHLDGGHVRRIIGNRTFSVEYTAKKGINEYTNYMLRFGCRYLEIWAEEPIKLEYAGIIPQYYPVKEKVVRLEKQLDQRIYDLCVNTLKLSMMEHYVDCPWREQALYAFDSRNQMLSGYYAFSDMNAEYARSNLKLISMDRRFNDLLSICYPTGKILAIPSFSLHFFRAVWEYYRHTGDVVFLREVYPKLNAIIKTFDENITDGLVYAFSGKEHWNFYDWSEHLDGSVGRGGIGEADSVINLLYITALDTFENISNEINEPYLMNGKADLIRESVRETFFDADESLFSFKRGEKDFTELANSLAIISNTATDDEAKIICEKIVAGRLCSSSLSIKCFTYDALFKTDNAYKSFILDEIRQNYSYMLDAGATCAWETIKGADDFGGAGSLCHGWSAIPVYYYHKFGLVKPQN